MSPHKTTRPMRPVRRRRLTERSAFRQAVESCHGILMKKAIAGQNDDGTKEPCRAPHCGCRTGRFFRVGSQDYYLCYAHRSIKLLARIVARKLWRERPR
ncbi:MAG: hypothetical protein ABFE07_28655 [Armatimonadia bacterium]